VALACSVRVCVLQGPLSNLSYSIVAVYITILFTIGQFVRLAFGNQTQRIPVEDLPNANKLVQIVEGIYIARQKKQLAKEEILYRRLLKIYRTPALLLLLTARQDTAEEKRQGQTKEETKTDDTDDRQTGRPTTAATNGEGVRARRTDAPRSPVEHKTV
jgi:hypothetical protein